MVYDPTSNPTTTTTANDVYFSAYVLERILLEERPYNVSRPFVDIEGHQPASVVQFPIQDDPGVATTYTEGTGLSNTALNTSNVQATALNYGQMTLVTDESDENTIFSALPHFAGVLGRSAAEYVESTISALWDDFANTYGTSGVPTTYSDCLAAHNGLAARDQLSGQVVFILDPAQVGNVQQDLATTGASWTGNSGVMINGMLATELSGNTGLSIAGAPVFQTSLVPSTGGAALISQQAQAAYEPRAQRLEMQRLAEIPGTKVVVTGRFGVIEKRDRAGSTIVGS